MRMMIACSSLFSHYFVAAQVKSDSRARGGKKEKGKLQRKGKKENKKIAKRVERLAISVIFCDSSCVCVKFLYCCCFTLKLGFLSFFFLLGNRNCISSR